MIYSFVRLTLYSLELIVTKFDSTLWLSWLKSSSWVNRSYHRWARIKRIKRSSLQCSVMLLQMLQIPKRLLLTIQLSLHTARLTSLFSPSPLPSGSILENETSIRIFWFETVNERSFLWNDGTRNKTVSNLSTEEESEKYMRGAVINWGSQEG